jgi:outer membrane protein TolC
VADYRRAVLTADQEVEDNLAALRQLQLESVSESAAVMATAETAALQAQQASLAIQLRRMNASVLLVKALGGGWRKIIPNSRCRPSQAARLSRQFKRQGPIQASRANSSVRA